MRDCQRAGASTASLCAVLVALALCVAPDNAVAKADKTDVVVMIAGDRMVGEIKGLEFGRLKFKASYMAASVDLDWTKIKELESVRQFRVEFDDGTFLAGTIRKLESATANGDFEVADGEGTITRNFISVVALEPLEGSIWGRLQGSTDFGLTLNPEAGQTQYSANASVSYPSENFRIDSQASSIFSRQEGSEDSERHSFGFTYARFLSRNWFVSGSTQLLADNQLNLALRALGSGGVGRYFIHTNRMGLAIWGGIASTYEKYFDTTDRNGNKAESFAGIQFFRFHFASSQLSTKLLLYAGITVWGRESIDWETSISWEIWNDVFWKISVLENFDSRPPEGAPKNDFTLTTSFGVSF
jgi:putative salt-induced outer membrane protein YdiY